MQRTTHTPRQRAMRIRHCSALLAAGMLLAAVLYIQDLPRSYAASQHGPTTPTTFGNAVAAQPNALQPRVFLPFLRQSQTTAAPTATPRPTAGSQPPTTLTPMPTGMMEPIAPDWVAACPADTVPFEAQAWWMNDFGHVHLDFCAPRGQRISGRYAVKVRMTLFNNPGKLTMLQAQIDDSSFVQTDKLGGLSCPINQTCSWDDEVAIDTSDFPNDGWHHLRIRAVVKEPDGKELIATNFIPVYLNNGKPVADFRDATLGGTTDYLAGRGWYTDVNYTWSAIFNPPTASERVSGMYAVTVRPVVTGNPQRISRFVVKLDGTHTSAGETVYDGPGTSNKSMTLSIDTTKLANGWHSLLARTEAGNQASTGCAQCSGEPQIHAGVTKIWFYVQN